MHFYLLTIFKLCLLKRQIPKVSNDIEKKL